MSSSTSRFTRLAVVLSLVAAMWAPPAFAANGTWTGGGSQAWGQAIWGGTGNWVGSTVANGAGFTATFGNSFTNGYTVIVNTNRTIGNIVFTDPANANDIILATHTSDYILTLDNSGASPVINVTQAGRTLTINPRVAGTAGLTKSGPGTLILTNAASTISGAIVISGGILEIGADGRLGNGATYAGAVSIANGATFNYNSTGNTTLGGIVSGDGALAKANSGILTLTGANTFTGQLSVRNGTLAIGTINNASADGVLGNSALSVILGNTGGQTGTLQYTGATAGSTKKFTMAAGGTGVFQVDNAATALTLSGAIDGGGAMAKTGPGILTLSGANTYTGATQVDGGILNFSNKAARSAGTTVAAGAAGSVGLGVHESDAAYYSAADVGNLFNTNTLAGFNLNAASGVAIDTTNAGGSFDQTVALTAAPRSLTKLGAGTLILSQTNSYTGLTTVSGGTLLATKAAALYNDGGTMATWTRSNITVNSGGTLAVNYGGGGTDLNETQVAAVLSELSTSIDNNGLKAGSAFGFDTTNAGGGATYSPAITDSTGTGGGAIGLAKLGAGTLTLAGENTYTGSTNVYGGTLTLTANRTANSGSVYVGNAAGSTGTLNIQGNLPMGGSEMRVGTNGGTGIVNQTAGTVGFTSANALLIGTGTAGANGTYNLSGGSITAYASTTRGVMLGVNAGVEGNHNVAEFNLSDSGNLNISTSALMVGRYDSAANYTDDTYNQTGGTASVGQFTIGGKAGGSAYVNATVSITGGTFSATSFPGMGAGNNNVTVLTIGGTADVTLPAFPTARGTDSTATVYFDGGTLKPAAASAAYMGGLTNAFIKAGGATFDTTNGSITIAQNLLKDAASTGGGLTKVGDGTLTLSGTNTYTGATTVSGGQLAVSGSGTLAGTSGLSVAGGATFSYLPSAIGTTLTLGTLGAGSTLSLSDGSVLRLAWDAIAANNIMAFGAATVGDGTGVGVNMIGACSSGTAYTILTAASGLDTGNYTFLNPTDYTAVMTKTATSVKITPTSVTPLATAFWNGGLTGSANVWAASDGTTSNWFTSAGGGATALVPGAGADVTISAAGPTVAPTATRLGADMAIKTLTIADTTSGLALNADGYTLTVTPGASTDGIVMNAGVPASSIGANLALGANQTWTNNSADALTVSGAVSGAFALTKAGAGTLTMTGANTYTGATTINGGTLTIGGAGQLGAGAYAASITNNGAFVYSSSAAQTLSGTISGAGTITQNGPGALTLSGANSYSGQTSVAGGTLNFSAANNLGDGSGTNTISLSGGAQLVQTGGAALNLGANRGIAVGAGGGMIAHNNAVAAAITVSGNLTGTAPLSFQSLAAGGGTFILSGNNSGYTGDIAVGAQSTGQTTLQIASTAAAPGGGSITLNYPASGATGTRTFLSLQGASLPSAVTLNMTSFNNGGISLRTQVTSTGAASVDGPITVSGDNLVEFLPNTGSTLTVNGNTTVNGAFTGTMFIRGSGNGVVNGTITIPSGKFAKTDAGSWTVTSTGNSWATSQVAVGTLKIGAPDALATTAPLTMGQGDTNAATFDLGGFNQTVGGLVSNVGASGVRQITNTSGTLSTLTIDTELTTQSYGSGAVAIIAGNLAIVKKGTGTQTLLGTNTFTGGTTVSNGTLVAQTTAASTNSLSSGAAGIAGIATLQINNLQTSGTTAIDNTFTGSGRVIVNFAAGTTARNTGITGVSGFNGTIELANAGANGDKWNLSSAGVNAPGATVQVDSGSTMYFPGGTTTFAGVTVAGAGNSENRGALRFSGSSILNGPVTLSGNATIASDSASTPPPLVTGDISVTGAYTLTVGHTSAAGNLTMSGVLGDGSGTLSLTKTTAGVLTLTGASTYTGATTISAGTLRLGDGASGNDGTIANTSGVTNNGTLVYNRFGSTTAGYAIGGAGAVVKTGPGTQTLSGANTYTGATTVNAGTLTLDYSLQDNSKLSDTAALILSGAALNLTGGTHTEIVASTTLTAGVSSVTRALGAAVLAMGAITTSGGLVNFGAGSIATTTNSNDAGGILGVWATVGSDWAGNDGSGNIVAYTGGYTDIAARGPASTISDGPASNVRILGDGTSGHIELGADDVTVNSLWQVNADYAATVNTAGKTLQIGGIRINSGSEALTIGASAGDGTLSVATAGGSLFLVNAGADKTLTVNAAIADNSTSALIATGNVTLNGANAYAGATTITNGTLKIGSAGSLGSGAYAGNIANNGTLQYSSSADQTLWGAISGPGALTKDTGSSSTLTLSGPNTYTGNTTVSAGNLTISGTGYLYGASGSSIGTVTVAAGAGITLSGAATNNVLGFGANAAWVVSGTIDSTGGSAQTLPKNVTLNNGTLTGIASTGDNAQYGTFYSGTSNSTITANGATNTISADNVGMGSSSTLTLNTPLAGDALSVSSVLGTTAQIAGALTKTGLGTVTIAGANTYTGATTVSEGALNLTGNRTAAATGGFNVGNVPGSTGTLNVSNGTFTVGTTGSNFLIGSATGATGIMNQSGGSLTTIGNQLLIGNGGGTGTYNLSGGTLTTIAGSLGVTVGVNTGSTAAFNLSDSGVLSMPATSTLQITRSDNSAASGVTGTFTQTGGTATVGILQMGGSNTTPANNANATATLDLSGGTFTVTTFNQLSGANNSTSTINISGMADVTLPAFPTARGAGSAATITFDGGTLRPAAASATYMGGLTNAFIKAGGAHFDVPSGRDITIAQALLTDTVSTGGGLTKDGAGTLTLTGANTYTGDTIISDGVLTISNPYLYDASTVTISIVGGLNLAFANSSVIDLVADLWLGGVQATPGTTYDKDNTVYITGTGKIMVAGIAGDTNSDNVVDAADFITLKKNFGTNTGSGVSAGDFNASGTVNWADLGILMSNMGTGGTPATAPEPATLGLLAIGGLALLRRRRA